MLKFFFHRDSWMVRLMNALAGVELLALLVAYLRGSLASLGWATPFLMATWLLLNLLNLIPWYGRQVPQEGGNTKLGIRLHFQKNLVPASYLLAFDFALKWLGVPEWGLFPLALLFLPFYYVNAILLFFHFRDSSTLTPGYFSHNFYLKDEEPPCTP